MMKINLLLPTVIHDLMIPVFFVLLFLSPVWLLFLGGCEAKQEPPPPSQQKPPLEIIKAVEMSPEEDKIFVSKVMAWIDDNFNDPQTVEWKEKRYYRWPRKHFEQVEMDVTFRLINRQGVRTLHKIEFWFGGPSKIVDGVPNFDKYAIMRTTVIR